MNRAQRGHDPLDTPENDWRRRVVAVARDALDTLRNAGTIGDDAYRRVEGELDWLELSSLPAEERT
ncbi:hypothetical protein J2Y55_002640 [Bosea sp. BE125]|uniref:hypothetical protein n=1 Tax=Bosea sp. BE125 TaxID=2817909 RepID=UPI0028619794|nr:hypothetical protein [Bosea sp. BE125]MDR6871627.1 hypothetical protein [Bosea sp. BE125]